MSTATHPDDPMRRPTETYPVVQRTGIVFFRRVTQGWLDVLRGVAQRGYFARDMFRALADPKTYLPETLRQMYNIGVGSVPLTVLVAAFIGAVIAIQLRYQLFAGVQLSLIGLATRTMIILEIGPLLTGLVLTGRVGARMTAEIGTMRVTEQIDALETLAYDPQAFLILPRFLAAIITLPALVVLADAVGIASGYFISVTATDVTSADFLSGAKIAFSAFHVVYSLIKATMFGAAISFVCSYEGYVAEAGAEGVGRSTARSVVIASVTILVLDALTAAILAPFISA